MNPNTIQDEIKAIFVLNIILPKINRLHRRLESTGGIKDMTIKQEGSERWVSTDTIKAWATSDFWMQTVFINYHMECANLIWKQLS